ncbi:MAG: cyclodeaminase/cyclohydrolase family protein [Eubacteriaceae bacterium]|nr:cyclodeaminase/cyclohydrolase family protein [Eubacteriaceae bacterium]
MKYIDYRLQDFVNESFSKSPTPGGGAVSAIAASLGAALGGMVCNLTIGKKKYAIHEERLEDIIGKLRVLTDEMMSFVDKDAENFIPLSKAYALPSSTEEEKENKKKAINAAIEIACEVPKEIVKKSYEAIVLLENLSDKCSPLVISDVGVGVLLLKSGLVGGWMNVLVNIMMFDDEDYARNIKNELMPLVTYGTIVCDRVYKYVEEFLENQNK